MNLPFNRNKHDTRRIKKRLAALEKKVEDLSSLANTLNGMAESLSGTLEALRYQDPSELESKQAAIIQDLRDQLVEMYRMIRSYEEQIGMNIV